MVAAALGILVVVGSVEAYKFLDTSRWHPEAWGQGETLVFELAPGPEWEVYWDSAEAVLPYVERALNAWSGIPTADISWSVVGVGEDPQAVRDGRNTIFIDADSSDGCAGYARVQGERSELLECDVALCLEYAQIPDYVEPEDIERHREWFRETSVHVFAHEFGHCLGLGHADRLSINARWDDRLGREVHPGDPAMSYGTWWPEEPAYLAADDRVGASLLRPALPAAESGSVSGVVHVDGEPAAYAHVWALPSGPDPLRDRIGRFSDAAGIFLFQGLEPGNYAFWAQPIASHSANHRLLAAGAIWELMDTIAGPLTPVRAGHTTENVEISMRRGRVPRAPPDEVPPEWERVSLTSMRRAAAEVCPGIRVEAERPYPADGPLWLSRQEFSEGRDVWFGTTVTVAWSPRGGDAVLEWVGPYRDWWWRWSDDGEWAEFVPVWVEGRKLWNPASPFLDVSISDYRIEERGSVARHIIEFAWPGAAEATVRFRSADGTSACDGEPRIVCNVAGCELRR